MSKGGFRPGAGRKRNPLTAEATDRVNKLLAQDGALTPLEVMVTIMIEAAKRDDTGKMADRAMAMEAAKQAAPYMHPKLTSIEVGGPGGGAIPISFDPIDGSL